MHFKSTRCHLFITTSLFCVLFFSLAAQNTGKNPLQLKGYSFASENGVISRALPNAKTAPEYFDNTPLSYIDLVKQRLGVKPENSSSLSKTNEYEFYAPPVNGGYDVPMATVSDGNGNTYITGASSDQENPGGNLTTIKLNSSGEILWEVRKPVTMYAVEMGFAITLDVSGDLLVTGSLWNGTDFDMQLLKYSPEGDFIWESSYEGEGGGVDLPVDIAIDSENNILLTGLSWSGNSIDYLTLKYSSAGTELWEVRDSGFGEDTWNEPSAISTDAENNVYVTGYSSNEDFWASYYTVKYTSSGEEVWQQRYTSQAPSDPQDPESPLVDWNSLPRDIFVDGEGNTYVTGSFNYGEDEIGTIKYNSIGEELWIQSYRSGIERTDGFSITEGVDGNIFVAGSHNGSFSNDGFVLLSYSPTGEDLWAEETADMVDTHDIHLKLDGAGDPVIAGWASVLLDGEDFLMVSVARAKKYSSSGNPLQEVSLQLETADTSGFLGLTGLELDAEDNIYMVVNAFYTSRGSVYETAKFSPDVTDPVWDIVYTTAHGTNSSMLYSFADGIGNTYSTGEFFTVAPGMSMLDYNRFLSKHNAEGDVEWELIYNSANGNASNGILATADAGNNLIVMLLPEPTFDDTPMAYKLKKYSNDGEILWEIEKEYQNPLIYDLQTDADGNIYLSGAAKPDDLDMPVFVLTKFNSDGDEQWTSFSEVDGADAYSAGGGVVTANGEFIQPGSAGIGGWFDQQLNFIVTKYSAEGEVEWSSPLELENLSSGAVEVVLDEEGNIYATGTADNTVTFHKDILTAKYSGDGEILWSEVFGVDSRNESAYTLERLSSGDIVVVGYSLQNMSGEIHNAIIRYNEEGEEIWVAESESMRYYYGFHVDAMDNIYVLNQVIRDPFPYRLINSPYFAQAGLTIINNNGIVQPEEIYTGPEHTEFLPQRLIAHTDGRLLMGGTLLNESFYSGVFFLEWDELVATSLGENKDISNGLLGQNFPNPFNQSTRIPFLLKKTSTVELRIYDVQGRLVSDVISNTFEAGENQIKISGEGLVPGQYFYQLKTDNTVQTGKMTLIK